MLKSLKRLGVMSICVALLLSLSACDLKSLCWHFYDNACDAECNICGAMRVPADHVVDEWTIDENTHSGICTVCGESINQPHEFDVLDSFDVNTHSGVCAVCGESITQSHKLDASGYCEICPFEKQTPPDFHTGYITQDLTTIETEYVKYIIGPGIYVVDNLAELTDECCRAIEAVSGLKISEAKRIKSKPIAIVQGGDAFDWDKVKIDPSSVCMYLMKEDLFIGNSSYFINAMTNVLRHGYYGKSLCLALEGGFNEYTKYKALKYLEEKSVETGHSLMDSNYIIQNMRIYRPIEFYKEDIEYWIKNEECSSAYEGNGIFSVGIRLMAYFDEVYGSYSKWITEFGKDNKALNIDSQIKELKSVYGEDSLDNFYSWLKGDGARIFEPDEVTYDISSAEMLNIYPYFSAIDNTTILPTMGAPERFGVKYKDLYINIDEVRKYLVDYKKWNVDELCLNFYIKEPAKVKLYSADGSLLRIEDMPRMMENSCSLEGASYIKLDGEGSFKYLEITGYDKY